ncbi:MAG: hypothetical protein JSR54_00990 [Proteobacteria bacterium]|nr:hypothetical protein [Pseudomonadota bacterium]
MGIEFRLSDRELPASLPFVSFLEQWIAGGPTHEVWADQTSEGLKAADPARLQRVRSDVNQLMAHAEGRLCVRRAYELLVALLIGDIESLRTWQAGHQMICVVGIPRSGGSFLTAELFRSIGLDPVAVPGTLAHDEFPEAGPFALSAGSNGWVRTMQTTAEYLAMTEFFYKSGRKIDGRVIVPKKLTQAAYAGTLFRALFGPDADFIVTVRHPVAACVSTYEKSGGLPSSRQFAVRSNIEAWCLRDVGSEVARDSRDYFDVYLRYWELYHARLVTDGLLAAPRVTVVPFGHASCTAVARHYHERHASSLSPKTFREPPDSAGRHPEWLARAQGAIERIADLWRQAGHDLPVEQLLECR